MPQMKHWLFLTVALSLNAAANLLMKVGANAQQRSPLAPDASLAAKGFHFLNFATIAGLVLFAANVLIYRKALDGLPVSVAYPVMVSVGLVIVATAAALLPMLNERISGMQIAGMAAIALGVWLVAKG